jgi:Ca2+-binding RTX toxin-like protein
MDGDIAPSFVGAAVGGNIAPAIEFRNSNQTNAANHFLTVHLSDESLSEFRRINNQEISSIINLLQIDEYGNRIIGTRGARPNFIDNPNYRGDIGRNVHIVDRNLVGFSDEVTFNILTSVSSDTIYGSRGAEVIRSNQGDDIVFPTAGRTSEIKVQKDEVFGGLGDDIVSYAADLVELDLRSFSSDGNSSGVRVFDQGVEIGVLKGFESFHTYGASNLDLSELGPVDPDFSTNYTIVTGSGGTIKGSTDDDVVMLSFNESYNTDVASAYNEKVSVIEGNSGFDRLYLDFSNSSGEFEVSRLEGPSNFVVSHEGHILVRATDVEAVDIQAKNQSYNFQISQLAKDFSSQEDDFLLLEGGLSDDVIYGGAYNEKISSYSGNDIIVAGSGDDDLNGGEGNNTYSPGSGNDKVNLSGGSDLIILEEGDDVIVNFDITDRLVFKKIKEVKLKKLGKENYDTNVIVGHNELQYKNDFTSEFNTVEFKDLGFASALWKAVDSSLIPLLDSAYASAIYNSI